MSYGYSEKEKGKKTEVFLFFSINNIKVLNLFIVLIAWSNTTVVIYWSWNWIELLVLLACEYYYLPLGVQKKNIFRGIFMEYLLWGT